MSWVLILFFSYGANSPAVVVEKYSSIEECTRFGEASTTREKREMRSVFGYACIQTKDAK